MSITLRNRKSGRVYEIRVSRGRNPSTGKQLSPYTMTWKVPDSYSAGKAKTEARRIEGKFKAECEAGLILTKEEEKENKIKQAEQKEKNKLEYDSKPTFHDYAERYFQRLDISGHAPTTISTYKKVLAKAGDSFDYCKMEEITKGMLKKYLDDLQDKNGYCHSTLVHHYCIIKAFFNSAMDDEIIEASPMNSIKRPRRPKTELITESEVEKSLDEATVTKMMGYLNIEPIKWKTLVIFMLDTGCRRGEVSGMKWENVNLRTGEVTVCNNRQYVQGQGVIDTTPKNGRVRKLVLTSPALLLMKQWKKQQSLDSFHCGTPRSDYCFAGRDGEGLHPQCITRYFQDFGKKYGFEHFHPHILRHTMATISIANGADIVSVSEKLGHSNAAFTLKVYSHANEEAQKRANDILSKAIYGSQGKQA